MELKRCPFCGEKGHTRYDDHDSYIRKDGTNNIPWIIGCYTDGCFCEIGEGNYLDFRTEQEAIEAWNKRIQERDGE